MAKGSSKEEIAKVEDKLNISIRENKKTADSAINNIINRLSKVEKEIEALQKEKEAWKREKETLEKEREKEKEGRKKDKEAWKEEKEGWKKERDTMKEEIDILKAEVISLRDRSPREEGEIVEVDKEAIKEELTEAITKSIEGKMEATREGWVEVVKRNIKKEVKEDAQKEGLQIVNTTIEEERMRHARRLNVRVTGIPEVADSSPEGDGRALCTRLGYPHEGPPPPFLKAWRAGKDMTKRRALIIQFRDMETRTIFMRKRVILRGLEGAPIFVDDDLTRMQLEHRRACMPRVLQARREGKKAFYRDGRVIIDGRPMD